jgi:hypothetical protein
VHPVMARPRLFQKSTASLLALGLAVLTASCSSAAAVSGSASSSAGPKVPQVINFTFAEASVNTSDSADVWALERGIWQRLGLNVTMPFQGSIENTEIASGRDVVGVYGTTGMFPGTEAGHAQSIIFSEGTGNSSLECDVQTSSPDHTMLDLAGQSVGVIGVNGGTYGAVAAMSAYIVKKGKAAIKIVIEPDTAALVAATESGAVAAGCANGSFGTAEKAGLTRTIVQADSPLSRSITGPRAIGKAAFGLNSELASDRTAIVRLVAGTRIADAQIMRATNAQVAAVLAENPNFAPSAISRSALISEVAEARPFFAQDEGYISPTDWNDSLKAYAFYGLNVGGVPINLHSSAFSYKDAVDMSYWNAATPLVNKYYKTYGQMG